MIILKCVRNIIIKLKIVKNVILHKILKLLSICINKINVKSYLIIKNMIIKMINYKCLKNLSLKI